MNAVYLVDACRSPIGLGDKQKGIYKDLRADDLAVQTLTHLLERTGLNIELIDGSFNNFSTSDVQ